MERDIQKYIWFGIHVLAQHAVLCVSIPVQAPAAFHTPSSPTSQQAEFEGMHVTVSRMHFLVFFNFLLELR